MSVGQILGEPLALPPPPTVGILEPVPGLQPSTHKGARHGQQPAPSFGFASAGRRADGILVLKSQDSPRRRGLTGAFAPWYRRRTAEGVEVGKHEKVKDRVCSGESNVSISFRDLVAMLEHLKPDYSVQLIWSQEDAAYMACIPELPGCMADGATQAAALANVNEAARVWIEVAKEEGRGVPPPRTSEDIDQECRAFVADRLALAIREEVDEVVTEELRKLSEQFSRVKNRVEQERTTGVRQVTTFRILDGLGLAKQKHASR